MRCSDERTIREYLAARVSDAEAAEVRSHLAKCAKCQRVAERLSDETLEHPSDAAMEAEDVGSKTLSDSGSRDHASTASTMPENPDSFDDDTQTFRSQAPVSSDDQVRRQPSDLAESAEDIRARFGQHSRLGRFELKHRLGFGGFGVVYLAYDTILKREVALKLPRHVALADTQARFRFLKEAEAVAGLYHPNIVPLYDAGEVDGVCYLASAYCRGLTLSQWMEQVNEPIEARIAAQIVAALADAVEHAHRAGILHRDLKPGNVMLDQRLPMGDLPFTPRLTDFGLALVIGSEVEPTARDTLFGTPRYMAPEQASGRDEDLGPHTEVYSLGVILYEMLAGRPPIRGSSKVKVLQRVAREEPAPVSHWVPNISADLEVICAKSMAKKTGARYATAAEFADDLGRYLRGEPTKARPDTVLQAATRWVRRNPAYAWLVGALAVMTLVVIMGLFAHNRRLKISEADLRVALNNSREAEQQVDGERRRAEQMLYASDVNRAARAWHEGDSRDVFGILRQHIPRRHGVDQRGFEWWWYWSLVRNSREILAAHRGAAYFVTFSPDEHWIASVGQDGTIRLIEANSPREQRELLTGQGEVNGVDFSSNGKWLASAGDDGSICVWDWQADVTEPILRIPAFNSRAFGVLFNQSDQLLITCGEEPEIRLWDAVTGEAVGELRGHERAVEQIALSSDGSMLASAGRDEKACLWDLKSRERIAELHGDASRLTCVAFSPDGSRVATGSIDGAVTVWDVSTSAQIETYHHLDGVQSVVFSADGTSLYACDRGGIIRRWPKASSASPHGQPMIHRNSWTAHEGRAYWLAWSQDGERLVSAGEDGLVHRWGPATSKACSVVNSERQAIHAFAFASDGKSVVGVCDEGVHRWNLANGERSSLNRESASGRDVAFSPTDDWMALGEEAGVVHLYNVAAAKPPITWQIDTDSAVKPLCFVNQNHDLALIDEEHEETILVYSTDGTRRTEISANPYCRLAAASPDGSLLAYNVLNDVVLWDLQQDKQVARLQGHQNTITAIRVRRDGQRLVTASKDRTVRVWDVASGELLATCAGHRYAITDAALSPDGRTIASCDQRGFIKLWHTATGQELCNLRRESQRVDQIAFSPDGRRLAYLLEDDRIVFLSVEFSDAAW